MILLPLNEKAAIEPKRPALRPPRAAPAASANLTFNGGTLEVTGAGSSTDRGATLNASGGTVYRGVADKDTTLTEPGLIVYRFDAPLVFANAAFFTERLEELIANAGAGLKCVILDAEAISDFDSTAAEALENLGADLERRGVELWIARANKPLRDLLQATGLTTRIGEDNLYPSIRAAVEAYHAHLGST